MNSLKSLSFTISKCNNHKNPHLYPCHNAGETSCSTNNAESFKTSFSIASLSKGYSLESIAKIPAYINGVTSQNHSIGLASSGLSFGQSIISDFHIVSPTLASLIVFKPVTTYQIEPSHILLSLV
ncbi:hypothetical protein HOK00_06110 [bacterium]|nr:hypothetical protein [bacterium]